MPDAEPQDTIDPTLPAETGGAVEGSDLTTDDDTSDFADEESDFGPPFMAKTFGASFVWARGDGFVCTVLRVKEGENVVVSTQNRRDMHIMLTGGRALLEIHGAQDEDRVELMPAGAIQLQPDKRYRLIAMTEVELFTVYTPAN